MFWLSDNEIDEYFFPFLETGIEYRMYYIPYIYIILILGVCFVFVFVADGSHWNIVLMFCGVFDLTCYNM